MFCKNGASVVFPGGAGGLCGVLSLPRVDGEKCYHVDIKGRFHTSFAPLELSLFLLVLLKVCKTKGDNRLRFEMKRSGTLKIYECPFMQCTVNFHISS